MAVNESFVNYHIYRNALFVYALFEFSVTLLVVILYPTLTFVI